MEISKKTFESEIFEIGNNLEKLSIRNYRARFERIAIAAIFDEAYLKNLKSPTPEEIKLGLFDPSVDKMIWLSELAERYDIARIYRYIGKNDL